MLGSLKTLISNGTWDAIGRASAWVQRGLSRRDGRDPLGLLSDSGAWHQGSVAGIFAAKPSTRELIEHYADTAYYCANLNAKGVARAKGRMYVRTRKSERSPRRKTAPVSRAIFKELRERTNKLFAGDNVEEIVEYPMLDLLAKPNSIDGIPQLSAFDFTVATQLYLDITGRSYWQVEADGLGRPTQLWLLPTHMVTYTQGTDRRRRIEKYYYSDAATGALTLPPEQVIAMRVIDLVNPYIDGKGALAAAIGRQRLQNIHLVQATALLENRARPDTIISSGSAGDIIGRNEAKRIERLFSRNFRGAGAGGVYVSNTGLKIDPLSWSPRDMADLADAKDAMEQIARAFDVPLAMLDKDANRANSVEARQQHAKEAVWPRLMRLEAAYNGQLLPRYDTSGRLFYAFDNPVPEDDERKSIIRTRNLQTGFTNINEEREEEGWDKASWGDEPWFNGSMRQPSTPIPAKQGPGFPAKEAGPGVGQKTFCAGPNGFVDPWPDY